MTTWYEIACSYFRHRYTYEFIFGVDDTVYPYTDIPWFIEQMRKTSDRLINYLIKNHIGTIEFLENHTGTDIMGISSWYITNAAVGNTFKDVIRITVADPMRYKHYVDSVYPLKPSLPPLPSTNDVLEFIQKG